MTEEEIATAEAGIRHNFWLEYLQPQLQDQARKRLEALALGKTPDEDITRGWIQALRWVINLPTQQIALFKRLHIPEKSQIEREQYLDDIAKLGRTSPYIVKNPDIEEVEEDDRTEDA